MVVYRGCKGTDGIRKLVRFILMEPYNEAIDATAEKPLKM
jgi:hypothetical protein